MGLVRVRPAEEHLLGPQGRGARTRKGKPCPSPAVKGKRRCRMHGGAHGSGAPTGKRNGNYRHGFYTAKAIAERRVLTALIRDELAPLVAKPKDVCPIHSYC